MAIKVFATGGTIDKIYYDAKNDYQIGEPQAEHILRRANVDFEYDIVSVLKKDSLEINDNDRNIIKSAIESDDSTQIVITHGTDTMTKTAAALKDIKNKTIVITGAMSPALFRDSDAGFNLASAMTAVQILPVGVYILMNGKVFDPDKTIKNIAENKFKAIL